MSSCFYFVPARGGSKRFPLKNIAPVAGKPLVTYVIDSLQIADPDGEIVISTDNGTIAEIVQSHGRTQGLRNLRIDHRSTALGTDTASVGQVLQDFIRRESPARKNCFCVYPTAALLSPKTIRENVEKFERQTELRSLMGASEFNLHPWQALYRSPATNHFVPYFVDLFQKRSQEFPHFYASNGSFYLVRTREFLEHPSFYASPLELTVVNEEWVDINFPEDLKKLERILQQRQALEER